jgi:hypothetical protein
VYLGLFVNVRERRRADQTIPDEMGLGGKARVLRAPVDATLTFPETT